ncbi:MAG: cytochrome b/b6 domain-containing protein [Candidatus Omnitrophica bacterium]|nr:cytochrome b/b6 domain-containing protein [Candidatus Omnitrophota bacterium]
MTTGRMTFIRAARAVFLFLAVCAISASRGYSAEEISNDDCLSCHEGANFEKYGSSVHGKNLCTSCHNDVHEAPHAEKPAKVDCAKCHNTESEIYSASDHGRAVKAGVAAASCLDCHGEPHNLLNTRDTGSPVYRMNIPETCSRCHEDANLMSKYDLLEKRPVASYLETVHGKAFREKGLASSAECTDCHGSHDLSSPANPNSKIFWSNVPKTCGKCHENVLMTYSRSVHGKAVAAGKRDAPVCTSCHGEHTIRSHSDPGSSVYSSVIAEKTCGQCHASEKIISKYGLPAGMVESYMKSYHGLAGKLGVTTVANCASCHGIHNILPSSDPASDVNKKNLPKTCGKCHPNAGERLAKGNVHLAPSVRQDQMVFYVTVIYIALIVMTIGGMLLHNLLDFLAAFRAYYRRKQGIDLYDRFTLGERMQHIGLAVSFTLLAYTGFALRASDAWWALPFRLINPGFDWRGIAHRILAVIFVVLAVYHAYYLFFTARGRQQLRAMMVKKRDFTDVFFTVLFYFGLRKGKPKYARYSYIEKSEYWALVWGGVIMTVTGSVLMFQDFFMQFLAMWIFDVARTIHFFEAILAVLAIIVWHLYFNIFHPDHYPLNLAMMTGKVSEEDHRENSDPTTGSPEKEKE